MLTSSQLDVTLVTDMQVASSSHGIGKHFCCYHHHSCCIGCWVHFLYSYKYWF